MEQCRFCPGHGTTDQLFTVTEVLRGEWRDNIKSVSFQVAHTHRNTHTLLITTHFWEICVPLVDVDCMIITQFRMIESISGDLLM